MKTLICPTCGCSLVRLGVKKEQAIPHTYNGSVARHARTCSSLTRRNTSRRRMI